MIKVYPCGCIYWTNSERTIRLRKHNFLEGVICGEPEFSFLEEEANFREQHYNAMSFSIQPLKDEEARSLTPAEEIHLMDYILKLDQNSDRYNIIHNLVTTDPLDAIIE